MCIHQVPKPKQVLFTKPKLPRTERQHSKPAKKRVWGSQKAKTVSHLQELLG